MNTLAVAPVNVNVLRSLSPENCYLSISQHVGKTIEEHPAYRYRDHDFKKLQALLVSMVFSGELREETIVYYNPPRPTHRDDLLLARFWWDCLWSDLFPIHFHCKLISGSPAGKQPHTLILCDVEIEDEEKTP